MGCFITPIILTFVLALVCLLLRRYFLYTSAKANYAPGDISIAIVGGVAGAVFQISF